MILLLKNLKFLPLNLLMPNISAFHKLQLIVEYLLKSNSRDQVLAFLCENIDPYGELCAGLTSIIDPRGFIQLESRYGWSSRVPDPPEIHISDSFPRSESLRTMKIVVADIKTDSAKYSKATAINILADEYKTSVSIPVNHSVVYGFMFQRDMRVFEEFDTYLECIRSILAHWESEKSNTSKGQTKDLDIADKSLTNRQLAILDLIKGGRTNGSIAVELGYSESLIRQETIQIYKKLGISGRKALKQDLPM